MFRSERNREENLIIGKNLRMIRRMRDITLMELAENIGIAYQQVQKYECGKNSLAAADLKLICNALKCKYKDILGEI